MYYISTELVAEIAPSFSPAKSISPPTSNQKFFLGRKSLKKMDAKSFFFLKNLLEGRYMQC